MPLMMRWGSYGHLAHYGHVALSADSYALPGAKGLSLAHYRSMPRQRSPDVR